jgi:hypothetical protein
MRGPHVLWIDNFSKMYRKAMADMAKKVLQDALWTGIAMRKYMRDDVTLNVMWKTTAGFAPRVIAAMPADPFEDIVEMLTAMTDMTQDEDGNMPLLFKTSMFSAWGVNKVPIEPMHEHLPADVLEKVISCPGSLESFYPQGLMSDNVGSNAGLVRVMTKVRALYGHDDDPKTPDPR